MDAARKDEDFLKCSIFKFKTGLNLPDIKYIHPCLRCRILAIVNKNDTISFVNISNSKHGEIPDIDIKGIISFMWSNEENEEQSDSTKQTAKFVIFTEFLVISTYSISHSTVKQETCQNLKQIHGITGVEEASKNDVDILAYDGQHIVIKTPSNILTLKVGTVDYKVVGVIPICNGSVTYQINQSITVIFNTDDAVFSFYNLFTGEILASLDMTQTSFHQLKVVNWKFTADLRVLVFLDSSMTLWAFNVQLYSEENHTSVTLHCSLGDGGPQSDWTTYRTSEIGDLPWKHKLLSLFERHRINQNFHAWYKPSLSRNQVLQKNVITKQKRKKTFSGFNVNKVRNDEIGDKYMDTKLTLPDDMVQYKHGMDMVVLQTGATLVFDQRCICVCDLFSKNIRHERFDADCKIVLSGVANYPHLVVMETHLVCIVTGLSNDQEQFVSQMMTYAGASIADTVCHVNRWGRCAVPIHTLDIALKHRQLDTVTFFLKSKQHLFSETLATPPSPSSSDQPDTWEEPVLRYYDNLQQLEPALNLLIQTTRENTGDVQSLSFAGKLADITLNFLYELLYSALNQSDSLTERDGSQSECQDLQRATDCLLQMISEIRACVRLIEENKMFRKDTAKSSPPLKEDTTSECEGQNLEVVMEQRVRSNQMNQLQTYLCQTGEIYDFDVITQTCLRRVLHYLADRQIKPAVVILCNLGLNVNEKLWEISSLTSDSVTRDFILGELKCRAGLSQEHQELVDFVHELERNLKKISDLQTTTALEQTHKVEEDILQRLIVREDSKTTSDNENFRQEVDTDDSNQMTILLDWVQHWDTETRQLILFQTSDSTSDANMKLQNKLLVNYLSRYNKKSDLVKLIPEMTESSDSTGHPDLQNLHGCTTYIQDVVHQQSARQGIFQDTTEFQTLMKQLCLVGGPIQQKHPLERCHFYSLDDFHVEFITYCAKNNLHNPVWTYCEIHGISSEIISKVLPSVPNNLWLPLFANFWRLVHHSGDPQIMYETSLANAQLVFGGEVTSAFSLLQHEKTTAALATVMYSSSCLQQIISNTWSHDIDTGVVERAIMNYPKLHSTLYPSSAIETPVNDVTVYMLLKNNAAFEPSRLFGWQKMNTNINEECSRQMPHFSLPELVSKYGHTENIRYPYYLKQGRPSFAVLSFLAEEVFSDSPEIPTQRLVAASNTALWIGIRNFHNAQVSCTCVTFLEMLGQDSLLLRTLLQVGQEILVYLNDSMSGSMEQRKEEAKNCDDQIVTWLCNCVMYRKKHADTLLHQLEKAITFSLQKDKIPGTSFEAGQKWLIAVLYCQQLQLSLSTKFLESCAEADKWLPFLWFAQVHQYSKEQLQSVLYMFKSKHLQQHLHYVIENAESKAVNSLSSATAKQQKSESKAKDVRSTLYARIGVAKEIEQFEESSSDEEERGHISAPPQISEEEELEQILHIDKAALPDDLFSVVFAAQSSRVPWKIFLLYAVVLRNPILAELAACFKEASILPCLCGWMVAMMSERIHDRILKDHGKTVWKWNIKQLGSLIDIYLQQNWGSTLATGFHIYQPDSPLLPFLKFSTAITEKQDYAQSKIYLEDFKESMHQYCHGDNYDKQKTVIGNTDWLQQTIYRIIQRHFHHIQNHMCLLQMLKLLDSQSIILIFKFDVVNFGQLSRMLQAVINAQVEDVNFTSFLTQDSPAYEEECRKVIAKMVEKKLFHEAKGFASDSGLSSDDITIQEIYSEKDKLQDLSLWKSYTARRKFWLHCEEFLIKHKVSSMKVATFFQSEAEAAVNLSEKVCLYQICLQNLDGDIPDDNQQLANQLYHQLWMCHIREIVLGFEGSVDDREEDIFAALESTTESIVSQPRELTCTGKMPKIDSTPSGLTESEYAALGHLINSLLDKGHISQPCRLAAEFNFYSQDLAIIVSLVRLAMDVVTVKDLDPPIIELMSTASSKQHRASISQPVLMPFNASSLSISSSGPVSWNFLPIEKEKVIVAMEVLQSHCSNGQQSCKRILTCFIIACVLETDYQEVVDSKEFDILKMLLKTECTMKFKLASDYLGSCSLPASQVARFLCDSIVEAYKVMHANTTGKSKSNEDTLFDPVNMRDITSQFVKLCPDPSMLGDSLLDAVSSLGENNEEIPYHVLGIQTELLILSHQCHSTACNMEGISNVLRAARVLTACLQQMEQFSFMVHLLIGIGRYNEMTFIFDSLKQNDCFHLLLKKGVGKEKSFKLAILDYLKRYHPGDRETFDMVTHNFMMHREIAMILEKRAQQALAVLKDIPLDSHTETKQTLESAVLFYSDAAESYCKEGCLRHAQVCARQARLVALQLQFLMTGVKVIHLSAEAVNKFITSHPNFLESLIVSESYNSKNNWPSALCHNVIINGDFRYLQEFKNHIKLTPKLICESIERLQQSGNKTYNPAHLKRFISYCKDIQMQLQMAQELGIKDLVQTLQKKDYASYVQDILSTIS